GIAQWLSASALGAESRGFDPLCPDHFFAKKWSMKPVKASLHGTQCRFIRRELRFILCGKPQSAS
ncbi:MAG: hypothetical protein J6W00_02675, partial [Lentisphaeria bacterium]|nr:hypothetical protein [Lentisphaeria bacterium]